MKAFSEKGDLILRSLVSSTQLNWEEFTCSADTHKDDPILLLLKEKGYIEYSTTAIRLTKTGREFITITSFVEQRNKKQHH